MDDFQECTITALLKDGERVVRSVELIDRADLEKVLRGKSRDESNHTNDILTFKVDKGRAYELRVLDGDRVLSQEYRCGGERQDVISIFLTRPSPRKLKKAEEEKGLPAGHSNHGEAFNEGPRQKAYLMGGTGNVTFPATCSKPVVQKFIDDQQLAGAITMVARRGQVVHFETYGMMDLEVQRPMQKDAIFRIYSMTKPVAAVAVMMLCQDGKLELEAPVSKYLPELGGMKVAADAEAEEASVINADREMTVRDLMRHTSGLPGANRYMAGQTAVDKLYRQAGLHRLDECNLQEMVERLGTIPLLYQPGTKWHYSIAADVLGRLIEVVSIHSFDLFLAEHIFQPLDL